MAKPEVPGYLRLPFGLIPPGGTQDLPHLALTALTVIPPSQCSRGDPNVVVSHRSPGMARKVLLEHGLHSLGLLGLLGESDSPSFFNERSWFSTGSSPEPTPQSPIPQGWLRMDKASLCPSRKTPRQAIPTTWPWSPISASVGPIGQPHMWGSAHSGRRSHIRM